MKYRDLTESIIGCVYEVHNELRYGFLESVYEESLRVELDIKNIQAIPQKKITVRYKDEIVGDFQPDLLVEQKVIVEIKSVRELVQAHEVQLVNYLTATGKDVGLLVNFGPKSANIVRKIREIPDFE